MAATFDISAAYRTVPIRPDQQNYLCIYWKGKVYVDHAACFGLLTAGFQRVLKWVDEFLVIRLADKSWTEYDFMHLTGQFGVPWSLDKLKPFAHSLTSSHTYSYTF
jgi:hypothetical protein